ncbi:MAG: hypothetical protein ACHQYQ_01820 [Bacteriovoracales bacterium]
MRYAFFLLFIFLVGCGKKFDTVEDTSPLFSKTQDKNIFIEQTKEFYVLNNLAIPTPQKSVGIEGFNIMDRIPINLYDVKSLYKKENFVAVCRKSSKTGRREILVDRNYWQSNKNNPGILKALIIHELGHCELGKNHIDPPGDCRSIMEAILITNYSTINQKYYAQELFKPPNPCITLEKFLISN